MADTVNQVHTAEEEAANKAAAELQIKKKRKKRLHRILFVLLLVLIAAGTYGYYRYQEYQTALAEAEADVLALEGGEELTYGEITEVIGNDITVAIVVEGTSTTSDSVNAKAPDDAATPGGGDDNIDTSNMPEMPAGDSGSVPAAPGNASGDANGAPAMPSGSGAAAGGGSAPSGMPTGGMSQQSTYTETGETREYEIPVGTAVTSALGSTTTFAKLKVGNVIGIVTEAGTDNILRIKIVQ